jgi:hypothetical protein
MEPEHIQNYAKSENNSELSERFLRTHSIFNDLVLPDSIFIFHSVNVVYFIFKERKGVHLPAKLLRNPPPVSILKRRGEKTKKNGPSSASGKNTKKVAFTEQADISWDKNATRKQREV